MSSYLPSGIDYIPQIQPFNPNLNFLQSAMERKELQYKEGFNKINGVYGSLLNSPMLGTLDNETRDKFFKDIETNVQKISGLDLSAQENIDSAYKVFQPIIDDKNIMKNMAWTKNYQNEVSKGEAERYNIDKDGNTLYWDEGIRALHYQADDFAKAADQHKAQNVETARYTPSNNTYKQALEFAKKEGYKVSNDSVSGNYIVTDTNGNQLLGSLSNIFMGAFGNDPAANSAANTAAYVHRKDFVKSGASQYGSEDAAEQAYLSQGITSLSKQAKSSEKTQDNIIKALKAQLSIDSKKLQDNPKDLDAIQRSQITQDQLDKATSAKEQYSKQVSLLDPTKLLGADPDIIRRRVDGAAAIAIMGDDLSKAASEYSQATAERKIVVNPFAMKALDHTYDMAKMEREYVLKGEEDYNKQVLKYDLDNKIKEAKSTDPYFNTPYSPVILPGNTTADQTNPSKAEYETAQSQYSEVVKNKATDYSQSVYDHYKNIIDSDSYSPEKKTLAEASIKSIFSPYLNPNTVTLKSGSLSQDKNYLSGWSNTYTKANSTIKSDKYNADPSFVNSLSGIEKEHDKYFHAYDVAIKADHSNNLKVKNYIKNEGPSQKYTPEVKRNFDMFMNSDGSITNPEEFKKKLMTADPSKNPDEASDIYYDLKKTYTTLYNQDKLSENPDNNVHPWNGWSAQGPYGGAKGAMSLNYNLNADKGTSLPVRGLLSAYNDLSIPGAYIAKGGAQGFASESDLVKDEGYDMIAKAIIDDIQKGKWDKNETVPAGKILHQGIIAGNSNLTGITFIPSHETVMKYSGKPKSPGITSGLESELEKSGFTIVLPTDQTNNIFTKSSEKSLDDHLIEFEPVKTDKGKLGTYTIKKTGDRFSISGNYKKYDDNGVLKTMPLDPGNFHWDSNLINVDGIKIAMDEYYNALDKYNHEHWENAKEKLNSRN